MPEEEGVYRVELSLEETRSNSNLFRITRHQRAREIQFVVLERERSAAERDTEWKQLLAFDPSRPRWWEPLAQLPSWSRLPIAARTAIGRGSAQPWQLSDGLVSRLLPGEWQAYPLPISKPGRPHLVEVDIPTAQSQSLSIYIHEPELPGSPVTTMGTVVNGEPDEWITATSHRTTTQVLFWPRTKYPYLVLKNDDGDRAALFEQIRVQAGPSRLGSPRTPGTNVGYRRAFAYLSDPNFFTFGATPTVDAESGRAFTDWQTFLDGCQRLTDYLHHAGFSGSAVGVWSQGCTMYPAPSLDPSSRHDTGAYFSSGQDPVRKDVLELLLRLFDREGLQLVPILKFSATIPELEQLRTTDSDDRPLLVDHTGRSSADETTQRLPPYNPLDSRVQDAMIRAVGDVVERYSHHASFAGICVELAPNTATHLPGLDWGYDPRTVNAFLQEVGVAASDPVPSMRQGDLTDAWVEWRSQRILGLYPDLSAVMRRRRPEAKLYLTTARLSESAAFRDAMRPVLRGEADTDGSLCPDGAGSSSCSGGSRGS